MTLLRYIKAKKIAAPPAVAVGGSTVRIWTATDIERVRQLLPKIANGRKTRHRKKQQSALSNQHSGKTKPKSKAKKKPQPRAAVPHDFSHTKQHPKKK